MHLFLAPSNILQSNICFKSDTTFIAVRTGLEPVTPCVVGGARVELARGVLNIHLTLISVPTVQYSATTIVDLYG